jgi:hypothetical protein
MARREIAAAKCGPASKLFPLSLARFVKKASYPRRTDTYLIVMTMCFLDLVAQWDNAIADDLCNDPFPLMDRITRALQNAGKFWFR